MATEVFILDDSTMLEKRADIDRWAADQVVQVKILRRATREGFKSGSLNNWLRSCGSSGRYSYLLLADADTHLPDDYTSVLLARLGKSGLAFAQGSHQGADDVETPFEDMFSLRVDCAWRYEIPAQWLAGLTPMLGHGALIEMAAIERVGGFPNYLSDDIALSIILASFGKRGTLVCSACATEGYPRSYRSHWYRTGRWARGDADVVHRLLGRLLTSPVPLLGRLDFAFRELRLPTASSYWLLLMAFSALILADHQHDLVVSPLVWCAVPLVLSAVLPALFISRRSLRYRVWFVLAYGFLAAATAGVSAICTVQGFLSADDHWEPTGSAKRVRISPAWAVFEAMSGGLVVVAAATSRSWVLLAIGTALLSSPLMRTPYELHVLRVGVFLFWALMTWQIVIDVISGGAHLSHLLVLVGIAVLL